MPAALVVVIVVVVARVDVIVREAKERSRVLQTERERESERESARGTDRQRVGERERVERALWCALPALSRGLLVYTRSEHHRESPLQSRNAARCERSCVRLVSLSVRIAIVGQLIYINSIYPLQLCTYTYIHTYIRCVYILTYSPFDNHFTRLLPYKTTQKVFEKIE